MPLTMQQSMERFVHHRYHNGREPGRMAEACMNLLSDYLQHWSGLFQAEDIHDEVAPQPWEQELDDKMVQWLDGDTEPVPDLGALTIAQIDEEHLREFVGWYLIKDMALTSNQAREIIDTLQAWVEFCQRNHSLDLAQGKQFLDLLQQSAPETVRAVIAAHALLQMVRSGQLSPPSPSTAPPLQGFVSGMARLMPAKQTTTASHILVFDDQEVIPIPILFPTALHPLLHAGDVLHIYLASYSDGSYRLVDSGAIFPSSTWLDATVMERFRPDDAIDDMVWDQNPGMPLN
ncbi:MAG: hypothetical protein R8J84_07840 [Mariprofundales bacterium]